MNVRESHSDFNLYFLIANDAEPFFKSVLVI